MTLAAVLFDMDGTLVDTEKVWDIALRELAARYGRELSDEARVAMLGSSSDRMMELVSEDLGLSMIDRDEFDMHEFDIDEGADWIDARMVELFAGGVLWLPGAQELLAAVRAARVPTALVTNTGRNLVDLVLRTIGPDNFDAIVCGDEVANAKPHPEPYRTAAAALGVDPARCVAIEDSPTGIASARSAGCVVLAIPNQIAIAEPGVTLRSSLLEVDLGLLRRLTR